MTDPHLSEAARALEELQAIGPDAYFQNAPILIAEASLQVAYAEAITNRVRVLNDLISSGLDTPAIQAELHDLLTTILTQEAPRAEA